MTETIPTSMPINRRELLSLAVGAAAVSSITPISSAWTTPRVGVPARIDPMSLVDPEFRESLNQILKTADGLPLSSNNLATEREFWITHSVPPAPTPAVIERSIPAANEAPNVRVFVINAGASNALKPAILHMHGGGFVLGRAARAVPAMQRIARDHDCVIVTVDYR